jgi:hypothetical protein
MKFQTLADIENNAQHIEYDNHQVLGKWTAAQNFYHLAAAFEASVEGLPAGFPIVARKMLQPVRWFITRIRFPASISIPESIRFKLEPPLEADFEVQKRRLLDSIKRFEAFDGQHPMHPVLGPLTRNEWLGFHLRHCQHHLSFIHLTAT